VTIEIRIDEGACMGSHECSFWAPGVFDNREDGTAFVVDADGAPVSKVVEAAKRCPNFAIQVYEGGEQIA
jgi:ferredoxin